MRAEQKSRSSAYSNVCAGPQRDDHEDVVLAEIAGHADRRGLEHGRMTHHRLFDFDGRDVLAAPSQRVLDPVDVRQVVVGVQEAEIAGAEPLADADRSADAGPPDADDTYPSLIACGVRARQAISPTYACGYGLSVQIDDSHLERRD